MSVNRILDPSLESSSAARQGANTAVTDDLDVKVTGYRSKRNTRTTAATSATSTGVFLTPRPTDAGPSIPVTPGEVISASIAVQTSTDGRGKLDLVFYDDALTTLATAASAYQPVGLQTWGRVVNENVTVPAGATTVALLGHGIRLTGTNVQGDAAWFDALMLNDGPTALPYFDGDTPADGEWQYAWESAPHNSRSVRSPFVPTSVRQEIAAAASTVEGIKIAPYFVPPGLGVGCVRQERTAVDEFGLPTVHWNVIFGLGQDQAAADAFFEAKVPALVAALRPVMAVREAVPQQLRLTDGTTVLAGFINGFREE